MYPPDGKARLVLSRGNGQFAVVEANITRTTVVKPEVLDIGKKKKKKHSSGVKELQRFQRHMMKAARDVSGAFNEGLKLYLKKHNDSNDDKKDGAMLDAAVNVGKAFSRVVREAEDVPEHLSRAVHGLKLPRGIRRLVKFS